MSTMVIALGGNAIKKADQVGNIKDQFETSAEACREFVKVIRDGHRIALTHGNGPQVGMILRRVELSQHEIYPLPIDTCVSDSQGGMGYMLQQVMQNELEKVGMHTEAVTLITRCVVDLKDPAFNNPTKPIGSFMTEEDAKKRRDRDGWQVKEDAGRGWRRVIASPMPLEILEKRSIKTLMEAGEIVIACGGGGIPVAKNAQGEYIGVEAVIDKDLASALLALAIGADYFVILTGVDRVKVNFKKPNEKSLAQMTISEAKKYLAEGQFPAGSMGPKVQAAIMYMEKGGKNVIITETDKIIPALKGETGTRIVRD